MFGLRLSGPSQGLPEESPIKEYNIRGKSELGSKSDQ
jgi:hypothetical protein